MRQTVENKVSDEMLQMMNNNVREIELLTIFLNTETLFQGRLQNSCFFLWGNSRRKTRITRAQTSERPRTWILTRESLSPVSVSISALAPDLPFQDNFERKQYGLFCCLLSRSLTKLREAIPYR